MTPFPTDKKILVAAHRLLKDGGEGMVSMRRVAEACGITAMAIYRHYPNRRALLNAMANDGFDGLAAALKQQRFRGGPLTKLQKMTELFLDYGLERPRLFELMFLNTREGARRFPDDFRAGRSPTANLMVEVLKEGMEDGTFRRDDPWEIAFEMGAMLQGLVILYLSGRISTTPVQFRALFRRSFKRYFNGIRA